MRPQIVLPEMASAVNTGEMGVLCSVSVMGVTLVPSVCAACPCGVRPMSVASSKDSNVPADKADRAVSAVMDAGGGEVAAWDGASGVTASAVAEKERAITRRRWEAYLMLKEIVSSVCFGK